MVLLKAQAMLPISRSEDMKGEDLGGLTHLVYHDARIPWPFVSGLSNLQLLNAAAPLNQIAAVLPGVPTTALLDTGAPSASRLQSGYDSSTRRLRQGLAMCKWSRAPDTSDAFFRFKNYFFWTADSCRHIWKL